MLHVSLLGQFELRSDGERIQIPSRAGQSLFAFLILNAHTAFRREYLAGQIWGNLSEEQARHHLRQELWRVRKAICSTEGECHYLRISEIEIGFNPTSAYWLDTEEFKRIPAHAPTLTELLTGAALYRGELLPGFYEDWVLQERETLNALYEARMCNLLDLLIAKQEWTAVLEWAEQWISLGGTPEPAFRALMHAYAALGDHAKIAQTYARCQHALRENLDIDPAAETTALYEKLLNAPL